MDKIKIRIENIFQSLRSFGLDAFLQPLVWLEGVVIIAALTLLLFNLSTLSAQNPVNIGSTGIAPANREEIPVLSSDVFYGDKAVAGPKSGGSGFPIFNLTGTGVVKGIYKASIEDGQGNYYYVREGERVKGLLVKKISKNDVLLTDKAGNKLVIRLER